VTARAYQYSVRAVLMFVLVARSATAGALVHWQAPATCPSEAAVAARVASRLGPTARAYDAIEVSVRADGGGFVADIAGSRTLTSASCNELADAVALVVARLVLEQSAAIVVPEAPAVPRPQPPPPPAIRVEVVPAPAHATELAFGARASMIGGIGAQPGTSFGGELAANARAHALFVELAGELWSDTTTTGAAGGVRAWVGGGVLRAGWIAPHHTRLWLTGELGSIRADGMMVIGEHAGHALWAGLGAGGAVVVPLERDVSLVAAGEVVVALNRPQFALADGGVLYQPDAVAARLTFGVEVDWR
jgi:hypothetical protein